ncbi:alpha/beta hydrolase [candidate division KSB1 bacterium]|nr:alpha/beta hydrolase [candidate division KSB1 bacterium]
MIFETIGLILFFVLSLFFIAIANSWIRIQKLNPKCRFGSDQFVTVKTYRLHYIKFGDGSPLLMLHDLIGSYRSWNMLLPKLSRHFKCIVPDIIGLGQSDKSRKFSYTIDAVADLMVEFMLSRGFSSFDVIGAGFGGSLVFNMISRYQAYVRHAISIEGAVMPLQDAATHRDKILKGMLLPVLGPLFHIIVKSGIMAPFLVKSATESYASNLNSREKQLLINEVAIAMFLTEHFSATHLYQAHRKLSVSENDLLEIKTPTLQLYGANSGYGEALTATRNHLKNVPSVTQWLVKGGRHELHWQHPDWIVNAIVDFIKEQGTFANQEAGGLWEITITR